MNKELNKGLYSPLYEHDACGVGMVVNIHGNKSHELVDNALKVLENMEHRGAETRDKTGDGAGILLQIPHEFILLQGIPVPEKGKYGKQLVWIGVAVLLGFIVLLLNAKLFKPFALVFYFLVLFALVVVLTVRCMSVSLRGVLSIFGSDA